MALSHLCGVQGCSSRFVAADHVPHVAAATLGGWPLLLSIPIYSCCCILACFAITTEFFLKLSLRTGARITFIWYTRMHRFNGCVRCCLSGGLGYVEVAYSRC